MEEVKLEKYGAQALGGASFILLCALFIMASGIDLPVGLSLFGIIGFLIAISKGKFFDFISAIGRKPMLFASILLFLLYCVLSRYYFFRDFNKSIVILIAGAILAPFAIWLLSPKQIFEKKLIFRALVAGFAFVLIIFTIEAMGGYRLYKLANPTQQIAELERNLGRGALILIVLIWPTLAANKFLQLNERYGIFFIVLTGFLATRFGIDLNIVVYIAALAVYFIALKFPRFAIFCCFFVAIILLVFAPWIYGFFAKSLWGLFPSEDSIPLSYARRAQMWDFAIQRINEKQIFGWGFDASRLFDQPLFYRGLWWADLQLHPHSAPIHMWLELGLVGVLIFASFLAFAAFSALQSFGKNPPQAAAFCAGFTALILAWDFSYGYNQHWIITLALLLVGICPALVGFTKKEIEYYD